MQVDFNSKTDKQTMNKVIDSNTDTIGLNAYLSKVFKHLTFGVLLAAITVYATIRSGFITNLFNIQGNMITGMSGLGMALSFAPLAMIFYIMFAGGKMSSEGLKKFYYVFTGLMGVSISTTVFMYLAVNPSIVAQAFLATSLDMAVMWAIGYHTKKDLTPIGSFLIMAMWGLFIVGLIGMFTGGGMGIWYSYGVVLIFSGLIAVDIQKIKYFYISNGGTSEIAKKMAVFSAMSLFIDFVNIFLSLMRILASRD